MGRSVTGQGTLAEVYDWLGGPRGGPRRVGGPSGRSGTGRGTLGEVRNGSGDHRGGPRRVGGPSRRSVTCRGPSESYGMGWGI